MSPPLLAGNGDMNLLARKVGRGRLPLKRACNMRIEYLYRYPVKGFSAEALEAAEVAARRRNSVGPRFRTRARRCAVRSRPPHMAAENRLHVPEGECPDRRIAVGIRSPHRSAGHRAPMTDGIAANALTAAGREEIAHFLADFLGRGTRHANDSTMFRAICSATSADR